MFETVTKFEETIANFFGAPYAVATDSCTHAIELCLLLKDVKESTCPSRTYLSIPMTFRKLGIKMSEIDEETMVYIYELEFLQKIPDVEKFLIDNAKKRIVNPK